MEETLRITGAAAMKMGERTMTGFYTVDFDAIANDDDLRTWIDRSWGYVKTMPPKVEKTAKTAAARKVAKAPAKKAAATKAAKAPTKDAAAKKAPAKKTGRRAG
jgi:hypothetical protein